MGVRVYDKNRQAETEVTGEEAQAGWSEGRYILPEGSVKVIAKDGQIGDIDAADAPQMLGEGGYKLIGADEARDIQLRREESDIASQAQGAAEALAAGATFGGTTAAARWLGADMERMRAREEGLGGVADALNLAGGIAPTLLTGGSGAALGLGAKALAKAGARAVSAPGRALVKASTAAEKALARAVPQGGRAARYVPIAGREGVMGAGFGVGAEIHESALGDRDLAADKLLSAGLMGAILGAGGGVALSGLGQVAAGVGRVGTKSMQAVLERSGGGGSTRAAEILAKGQSLATGADRDVTRRTMLGVMDPVQRRQLLKAASGTQAEVETSSKVIADALADANKGVADSKQFLMGARKYATVGKLVDESKAVEVVPKIGSRIKEVETELADMLQSGSGFYGFQGTAKDLLKKAQAHRSILETSPSMGTAFREADWLKRELDSIVYKYKRGENFKPGLQLGSADRDAINKMQALGHSIRGDLMNKSWFGKAADMQTAINDATTAAANSAQSVREVGLGKLLKNINSGEVDVTAAMGLAKAVGKAEGNQKERLLLDALDKQIAQQEAIWAVADGTKVGKKVIDSMKLKRDLLHNRLKEHSGVAAKADDLRLLRDAQGQPNIINPATALAAAGHMAFGPLGAMAGGLIGAAISRPETTARVLARLMDTAERVNLRKTAAIARAVGGKSLTAGKAVARAAPRAAVASRQKEESRKDRLQRLRGITQMLAQSPGSMSERIDPHVAELGRYAPGVAGAITNRTGTAAAFLAQKMPTTFKPMWGNEELVDDGQLSKFERYADAVEDPMGVLDGLGDGSFTTEHAEALQAVYPSLYAEIQDATFEEVAKRHGEGEPVPYVRRVWLGTLLQIPLDDSMTPAAILRSQSIYAPSGDALQPQPPQPTVRAPSRPLGDPLKTQLDRIEGGYRSY